MECKKIFVVLMLIATMEHDFVKPCVLKKLSFLEIVIRSNEHICEVIEYSKLNMRRLLVLIDLIRKKKMGLKKRKACIEAMPLIIKPLTISVVLHFLT